VTLQLFEPASAPLESGHTLTDLSPLNAEPAGTHGFVRAALGHFVDDRATRLRFFGVNLNGVACLPERETALPLARHFRKLGINAVRLRGLNDGGVLLTEDGQIAASGLEQLDHFVAALKSEGIYFSLGLQPMSGYATLTGEANQRFAQGKVLDRFHPPFLDAQREFARRLLSHRNPETQLEYRAEPALLYVELNDEDTIFPSAAGSPDELPAEFRAELAQGYPRWLTQRTVEGLRAPGPADEEAKAELPTFHGSPSAQADYAQYLREIEHNSVLSLTRFVREDLGLKSMLVNSQVNVGGLAGVLREAEVSDFIDVHGRWGSPDRAQVNAADASSPLLRLAGYRVFGKPFVVSEYASTHSAYAAEMFPLLIGIAGLQDWDAVFAFAYADGKPDYRPTHIGGAWDLAGNPAKMAFLPTAAAAFRRGLVAPGQGRVELSVPERSSALPFTEDALPRLWRERNVPEAVAATQQLGIALRPGAGEITASHAARVAGALGSDTGELLWEAHGSHARFSINAPALKAVCGFLSDSALEFGAVGFEFHGFAPGFACASLITLDDRPFESSRRVLFSVSGLAQNAVRPSSQPATEVALAQYVPVTVNLPPDAWRAEALDAAGAPTHALAVTNAAVHSQVSTEYSGAALSYAFSR